MKISIVTTCFNSAKTIQWTIDSILSQAGGAIELEYIITDAGSTDGTLDIIRSYGNAIRLIPAKGLNQSAGINWGLRESRGQIAAFLNADDIYEPGALEKVCDAFSKNPGKKWLIGQCRIIDERGLEMQRWITSYKNFLLRHFSYFMLLTENFVCQPGVFLRRELLESHGYFSETENFVMDYEYWLRVGWDNAPIIIPEYVASFRRMTGTKSNTSFIKQFKDDKRVAFHYARKHALYAAMPLKYLQYLKTTSIYRVLYR